MRFAQSLLPLGLELQVTRCECFCPNGGLENHPDRPAHMLLGGMEASDGTFGFGVPVGGVPVGDSVYITAYMDKQAQATMSTINKVSDKLRDLHLQSLYSVTLHSLAPKFLYHVQHVFPEDGRQAAAKVDAAIRQAVASCVGDAVVEDDIARARLLLPARMYGGRIRSLEDVAPAAFIGTLCCAVPEFLDRRRLDFSVQPGFLPMLAPVLGHGSFDDGYPAPFQGLLATGTLTAAALQRHWAELQQEVGAEGRGAGAGALARPLGMNVETSGVGVAKAQRAITRQREFHSSPKPLAGVRFGPESAPGPSGRRPEHLRDMLACSRRRAVNRLQHALGDMQDMALTGKLPECWDWILNSRLVFLAKNQASNQGR